MYQDIQNVIAWLIPTSIDRFDIILGEVFLFVFAVFYIRVNNILIRDSMENGQRLNLKSFTIGMRRVSMEFFDPHKKNHSGTETS